MKNDIISAMHETVTLEGEEKKKWTAVFVSAIVLFSVCCMVFFHLRSDSLARYPFRDKTSRDLIRKYLTQEEIEYIIEYSIPPNMFIAYIQEDGFSIYHAAEYKQVSDSQWDKSPKDIVSMVEETRTIMSVEELENYLHENNYRYEDVSRWIRNESESGITLIPYAMNLDAYLDLTHSVSSRSPSIQPLAEELPFSSDVRPDIKEEVQLWLLRSLLQAAELAHLLQPFVHRSSLLTKAQLVHPFLTQGRQTMFLQQPPYLVETNLRFKVLWINHAAKVRILPLTCKKVH